MDPVQIPLENPDVQLSGVEELEDTAVEAQGIIDATDQYATQLCTELVADETLRAMETSLEHFRKRTGYPKPLMLTFEGFSPEQRLDRQKLVAKGLKKFSGLLKKNLRVTHEGLWDRMTNAWERSRTDLKDMQKDLPILKRKIEAGQLTRKAFRNAPWARVFAASGKTRVGGAEVLGLLDHLREEHDRMKPLIERAAQIYETLVETKHPDHDFHEALTKLGPLKKLSDELAKEFEFPINLSTGHSRAVDVEPLEAEQASALIDHMTYLCSREADLGIGRFNEMYHAAHHSGDDILDLSNLEIDEDGYVDPDSITVHVLPAVQKIVLADITAVGGVINGFLKVQHLFLYGAHKYLQLSLGS